MAIPGLERVHLAQAKLESKAADQVAQIATWHSSVEFVVEFAKRKEDIEFLWHSKMDENIKPLLIGLGLGDKKYHFIRIPGPKTAAIYDPKGSSYMIPVLVMEASQPTVADLPLVPGEITYIKQGINVGPKLVLIFVLD